jgi:xanthine dehydrogenase accessory factor
MADWLDALQEAERLGAPCVLVTLLSARGSTPREAGCKMVVTAEATAGTIGGGNLEFECTAHARSLLAAEPATPVVRQFALGPELGQCCGGQASVLFETIAGTSWQVAVFGAGHVGRALIGVLGTLACRVTWIDQRAEAFPPGCPRNVTVQRAADPESLVGALPAGTQVLVMTHEHGLDFAIIAAALARADLPYVGLIGSQTKRARFVAGLARLGLPAEAIRRLVCPIGVAGVGGKAPAEIAVAVTAQLLQARDEMTQAALPLEDVSR